MKQIRTSSEMMDAFQDGVEAYAPTCEGVELVHENGEPGNSLRNIRTIVKAGHPIASVRIANGRVLIVFSSGYVYYPCGLGYGPNASELGYKGFIEIASEAGFGAHEALTKATAGLPENVDLCIPANIEVMKLHEPSEYDLDPWE